MDNKIRKYGLIGYPLSHSFSKKYFTEKFEREHITDAEYDLYPLESIEEFEVGLHKLKGICGLNVTVPYKVSIIPELDWLSSEAKEIGAVNCIRIVEESPITAAFSGDVGIQGHDFRTHGFNTDAYGFEMSLKSLLNSNHTSALILGDGGAARAVKYVLRNLTIDHISVTRRPCANSILFSELTEKHIKDNLLIINTTPVGTSPNIDASPDIPYQYLTSDHLLYDLIYNPEETVFLKKGREMGAATKNGAEMLVLQAEKSWEIWTKDPSTIY
jgi:shikimate dehydrogenase